MERLGLFFGVDGDVIGSATTVGEIVEALAKRGCSNLTLAINLDACSDFPCAGGGYCDVYRGTLRNGPNIAIKSLRVYDRPEAGGDDERRKILKRAARELYHWSKLQHHNVLPLMGLAVFRGQLSMVSEWMENGDLMAFLRRNPDVNRSKLCMDICEGLCHIHTNGMVHGDLKAANIMISPHGTAMITDFGNAQLRDLTLKFTNTNTTKGGLSVRWAAPELLLNDSGPQVSKEADVYAYGMTVLETITGKVPYEGTSDSRTLVLVAIEKKVPPRPNVDICDGLWDLLNLCWAREPSGRPTIAKVRDNLQTLSSDEQLVEGVASQLSTSLGGIMKRIWLAVGAYIAVSRTMGISRDVVQETGSSALNGRAYGGGWGNDSRGASSNAREHREVPQLNAPRPDPGARHSTPLYRPKTYSKSLVLPATAALTDFETRVGTHRFPAATPTNGWTSLVNNWHKNAFNQKDVEYHFEQTGAGYKPTWTATPKILGREYSEYKGTGGNKTEAMAASAEKIGRSGHC